MSCKDTKTKKYKKISYTKNGKKVSYCKRLPRKSIMKKPPCDDDEQEIVRRPTKNWMGNTRYCRKKTNIKELRNQIDILRSLQKQLEDELRKKNNQKNNQKLNNKLKQNLNELKQEKETLQKQLNNERQVINRELMIDLGNIKTELKTCIISKNEIDKQLQSALKEQKQLIQVRDVLRLEVSKLENKIQTDENKLKKERDSCSYEKNVLLQKLDIISNDRDKLSRQTKNDGQLQIELDKKIAMEDSLREQLRNFNNSCDLKINKLTDQLTKSNNDLNETQQKFKTLSLKLLEVRKYNFNYKKILVIVQIKIKF